VLDVPKEGAAEKCPIVEDLYFSTRKFATVIRATQGMSTTSLECLKCVERDNS
jgi:hypothetical protein